MRYLLFLLLLISSVTYSQSNVDFRGDSARFYKNGGSMEVVIRNSTKDRTNGVLVNTGNGVTSFLKYLQIDSITAFRGRYDHQLVLPDDTLSYAPSSIFRTTTRLLAFAPNGNLYKLWNGVWSLVGGGDSSSVQILGDSAIVVNDDTLFVRPIQFETDLAPEYAFQDGDTIRLYPRQYIQDSVLITKSGDTLFFPNGDTVLLGAAGIPDASGTQRGLVSLGDQVMGTGKKSFDSIALRSGGVEDYVKKSVQNNAFSPLVIIEKTRNVGSLTAERQFETNGNVTFAFNERQVNIYPKNGAVASGFPIVGNASGVRATSTYPVLVLRDRAGMTLSVGNTSQRPSTLISTDTGTVRINSDSAYRLEINTGSTWRAVAWAGEGGGSSSITTGYGLLGDGSGGNPARVDSATLGGDYIRNQYAARESKSAWVQRLRSDTIHAKNYRSDSGFIFQPQLNTIDTVGNGDMILAANTTQANRIRRAGQLRSIVGGYDNTNASNLASSIIGSHHSNIAYEADHVTVVGGSYDTVYSGAKSGIANSQFASIRGSFSGIYSMLNSSITGDYSINAGGSGIYTIGDYVSSFGGRDKTYKSSYGGGIGGQNIDFDNTYLTDYSGHVGGLNITAGTARNTRYSFMTGRDITFSGDYGTASGQTITVNADYAFAHGRGVTINHTGSTVFADGSGTGMSSTLIHQFNSYYTNGYRFYGGKVGFNVSPNDSTALLITPIRYENVAYNKGLRWGSTVATNDGYDFFIQDSVWNGSAYTATNNYGIFYSALKWNKGASVIAGGRRAGEYNTGNIATFWGNGSGRFNTANNVAGTGHNALNSNTGIYAVANGPYSMEFNSGAYSTANGGLSLRGNVGDSSFGGGYRTLTFNNWRNRIALGYNAGNRFDKDAATEKSFTNSNVNSSTNQITITSHGYGSSGYVNLQFDVVSGTPPGGLVDATVYTFKIIDANTLQPLTTTISSVGSGSFKVTKDLDKSGSIVVGYNQGNTKANQAIFGGSNIVETWLRGITGVNTETPTSQVDINGTLGYKQLRLRTSYTPTSTADTNGNIGDTAWDDNYFYIKTSAGWKRTALSTF